MPLEKRMPVDRKNYSSNKFFDETLTPGRRARPHTKALVQMLRGIDEKELAARQASAELAIKEMGITFTVYTDGEGTIDRAGPGGNRRVFTVQPATPCIAGRFWRTTGGHVGKPQW